MAETSGRLARTWQRAIGRIRHGLVTQEILDRLARRGIVVFPYLLTTEASTEANRPGGNTHEVRWLAPADAAEIVRISLRHTTADGIVERLAQARCLGIFCEGRLAGYTWVTLGNVRVPDSGGVPLFELRADEAYLFDMFIGPEFRGARLAPLLRAHLLQALLNEGRAHCYSITLAFNRSSRRFKTRLGAREVELRIYLHLRLGPLKGLDCRLWRRRPHLRTPFCRSVPHRRQSAHAD